MPLGMFRSTWSTAVSRFSGLRRRRGIPDRLPADPKTLVKEYVWMASLVLLSPPMNVHWAKNARFRTTGLNQLNPFSL